MNRESPVVKSPPDTDARTRGPRVFLELRGQPCAQGQLHAPRLRLCDVDLGPGRGRRALGAVEEWKREGHLEAGRPSAQAVRGVVVVGGAAPEEDVAEPLRPRALYGRLASPQTSTVGLDQFVDKRPLETVLRQRGAGQ